MRLIKNHLSARNITTSAVVSASILGGAVVIAEAPAADAATVCANWDAIAQAESGGNWHINTGNGFGGGLQISPITSAEFGGPSTAAGIAALSKGAQIAIAERILAAQGPSAWPNTFVSAPCGTSVASSSLSPAGPVTTAPPTTHVLHSDGIVAEQHFLNQMRAIAGLPPLTVDGINGPATRAALVQWETFVNAVHAGVTFEAN